MMKIDWENFMKITPEFLSEQEKDGICEAIECFNPDDSLDRHYLIQFIRVCQELLRFKFKQVKTLTNKLDEITGKWEKEEGSKLQDYIDEIELLRNELDYYKKVGKSNGSFGSFGSASNDDLKRELLKLQVQMKELFKELNEKEKDLMHERKEVERYATQVAALEREKQEVRRELKALQEEVVEKSVASLKGSPESGAEKQGVSTEIIREKNKHIQQLLEDIEAMEDENMSLRSKISSIKDELSETISHMVEITAELSKLRHLNKEYESKEVDLKDKINSLMFQIEELVEEKTKISKKFDEYSLMFNEKVQEWKKVLDLKDDEIIKLKTEIKDIYLLTNAISTSDALDVQLNKKLVQQQEQIEILQQELKNATEEIISSSELIEKLKGRQIHLLTTHNQCSTILLEEKIKILEEKLIYAEEDACVKAEELSDLVVQLKDYESNVFGLPEAVEKIRRLEKTIEKKDFQTERLIEICNHLEIKLDNLEEQNVALRDKLGLSISDDIDTSGIVLRYKKNEELMQNLKSQLSRKEEELIKAKLKCRKLMTSVKMFPSKDVLQRPVKFENKKLQTNASQLEETPPIKLDLILEENDALRKGMHEILESIREQNCVGTVEVQSTCLKRLLEALDSRHVSGWYHPAMRLQAQLSTEEGKNDELRNQIRSMKAEEKKKASELQNAYLKIQTLENDFLTPRLEDEKEAEIENSSISELAPNHLKMSSESTLLERKVIELESKLHESNMMCDLKAANFEEKEKLFMSEKERLVIKIEELECQLNLYKNQNQHSNFKEFCELTSQITVLNREITYLKDLESSNNQNYRKLKQEFIDQEERMLQDILKLQNQKLELLYKIENLERTVLNSIPVEKFVSISNELVNLQAKYKCAISLFLVKEESSDNNENLKTEVSLLQSEKQSLFDELRIVKEKLIAAEALISEEVVTKGGISDELSAFARNLAASEIREINDKQKCAHLEKINSSLLLQQNEFKGRNKELLEKVEKLTEENFKYKEVERNLREKILNLFAGEERDVLQAQVEKLKKSVLQLSAEKENIQELFEISQKQCRAYEEWKDADQILLSSQNEQILLLQASNNDAASISRLSHELTMSKLLTTELTKKNNDIKIQLAKLLAENLNLEGKIFEHHKELFKTKKKHMTHIGYLYQTINEMRSIYACSVPFRDVEEVYNTKLQLKEEKKKIEEKINSLKIESQEYLLKKTEMETQLEGLEDLKTAIKSDAKNLIAWHNKTTELRIKEAKYRRENDFLIEEVSQLRNSIKKLNEELIVLDQKNIEREKEWEEKQLLWEESQFEMSVLLQKQSTKENFKTFSDASTFTENFVENLIKNESLERKSILAQKEDVPVLVYKGAVKSLKESQCKEENISAIKDKDLSHLNNTCKTIDSEITTFQRKVDSKEKEAFRVTIGSLQNIIKQKEETILRYQDLLKKGREEHGKAYSKLQEELKTLNEAFTVQSRTYNKLKNAVQMNYFSSDNIPLVVEKYVTTIQELEEELRECQLNLSSVNTQAFANKQEVEKWKNLATERLLELEDSRRRIELSHNNEIESYKEDIKKYQVEIERLTTILEAHRIDESAKDYIDGNEQFQAREPERDTDPLKSDRFLNYKNGCNLPQKEIHEQALKDLEILKKQLKFSKEETFRLKNQIRLLQMQPPKRPRTTGSLTTRSDSKSSVREGCLTSKIKNLEDLLTMSKEREEELVEMNKKKLKSAEEVARWEEKKKNQKLIKNLNLKLKEKEAEVEVLKIKNESFRSIISKCERDKTILESQLKAVKGNSGKFSTLIEKLTSEKNELETEVNILQNKLDEQKRHSSGIAAVLMHEKLETQERKLMAFELASKGRSAVLEEFEKLKIANCNLEKANLKLESENLSLKLKYEKEKMETKYLINKIKNLHQIREEVKCSNCEKAASYLKAIEKLKKENKRLLKEQKVTGTYRELHMVRNDLQKLQEDNKLLREKYLESMDRNIVLEDEVKSYRYQIHLMKEKDLAEILGDSSGLQASSKLFQEVYELKTKLAHKNNLLNRVKGLLIKTAAKEKASHKEVCFLQNETPPGENE